MIKKTIVIALLLGTLSLPLCAQTQSVRERTGQAPQLGAFGAEERYVLQPGDVLDIQYRYTPEFNQTIAVQPDGYISLQIGGDVKVSGRNLNEVRDLILTKARTRLAAPELTVILKEFQKPYVVVAGEVPQPGKFELREKLTAIQAVLLAGGFKDSAKSSQIVVFRKLNADTAEVRTLNFKTLRHTSDLENDLTLQPGDMILVPRNRISKIERYIRLASLAAFLNPIIR
ncbi:MAG TPA: polysaccharide biosynthesis/export family protein [Pyrinomonadaceae bacterium]|nr:polysaccharide biosynthesis/export family protein [Pyrinomonadaceae bacterium]